MNTKTRLVAGCAALLAFSAGCGTSSDIITVEPHPTILEVNPRDFLGSLKCGTGEGDLQRYVATLTDVTRSGEAEASLNFELPSSAPARCQQGVAFGLVVPGHYYTARIDGYDRSDLVPLAAGVPILVDPSTREPVAPRWSTSCGTDCPYSNGCPVKPAGDPLYGYAVRAEFELSRQMAPCWAWQNP